METIKNFVTVKELIAMLKKYDKDAIVYVEGGETAYGDSAELIVRAGDEWDDGEIVLAYDEHDPALNGRG